MLFRSAPTPMLLPLIDPDPNRLPVIEPVENKLPVNTPVARDCVVILLIAMLSSVKCD